MKLVYQAYGRSDIVQQVLFSVVSLKSHYSGKFPFEIEIYTDRKSDLEDFFQNEAQIRLIEFTNQDLQKWRGEIQFVHRVKLEILKAASAEGSAVVYLDGDTYFKANPDPLFRQISDSVSLMHLRESSLAEGFDLLTRKIAKFVKRKSFQTKTETLNIPPETEMWNAGVIGVSAQNTKWFQPMIDLTDVLYSKYQKHVMEQLAVSYYLNRETEVLPAESLIHHYWDQKPEFDLAIARFILEKPSFRSAVRDLSQFQWPAPRPVKPAIRPGILSKLRKVFERSTISK
jgi:hypothetical protein